MRILTLTALALAMIAPTVSAAPAEAPYKVLRVVKAGGDGGYDFVVADPDNRRLYIPRTGPSGRITVFDLDSLAPVATIPSASARGVAIDAASHHGFSSSKPVTMWDSRTLAPIRTIPVEGGPDEILDDPFNSRIYVFSHSAPNATVIDAKDGAAVGTIDLGGAPEQAVSDGKGRIYVDLEDKDQVAVIDAKTLTVTARYGLGGKGGGPSGLALDSKRRVLYVASQDPASLVMLNADTGQIIGSAPIGKGVDGAVFDPAARLAFSAQGDGSLTVARQTGPAAFALVQTLATRKGAKTLTLDPKTGRLLLIAAEFAPPPPGGKSKRGPMTPDSFSIIEVGR